jgi:hypothetical protein
VRVSRGGQNFSCCQSLSDVPANQLNIARGDNSRSCSCVIALQTGDMVHLAYYVYGSATPSTTPFLMGQGYLPGWQSLWATPLFARNISLSLGAGASNTGAGTSVTALPTATPFINVTFQPGWSQYVQLSFGVASYSLSAGRVYLRGLVTQTSGTQPSTIFILPPGFRPTVNGIFAQTCYSGSLFASCTVYVWTSGDVQLYWGSAGWWLSLHGIDFAVDTTTSQTVSSTLDLSTMQTSIDALAARVSAMENLGGASSLVLAVQSQAMQVNRLISANLSLATRITAVETLSGSATIVQTVNSLSWQLGQLSAVNQNLTASTTVLSSTLTSQSAQVQQLISANSSTSARLQSLESTSSSNIAVLSTVQALASKSPCCGRSSNWTDYPAGGGLYVDVSMASCGFISTPRIVASV